MKPAFELAEVIERFSEAYEIKYRPNSYIQRTLRAIQECRTPALGGHIDKCDICGHIRISYNSCRNRHCPKCQNTQREAWIESRKQELLPAPYFHIVFTVPDKLNGLFIHNPELMYGLLFRSAWETISQFACTQLQAETGMTAVLHSWGQNLSLHPHLHCVVPGGGIDYQNKWKQVQFSENGKLFLYRVENLSKVFRGKFLYGLNKQMPQEKSYITLLKENNWVVYAKEPFSGPEQVLEYLGRYTHKVAIGNHRILSISEEGVRFQYRDYRDNRQKEMTLDGAEFLRRFCRHILPKGFVRIRHYGIFSTTKRKQFRELHLAYGIMIPEKKEKKHWKQICIEHLRYDPDVCPLCKKGLMVTIDVFLPGRAPPLKTMKNQTLLTESITEN